MALVAGAANLGDAVSWADSEIEATSNPPAEIIDLSLSVNHHKALESLHAMTSRTGIERSARIYFRFLFRALRNGRVSYREAASHLYSLALDGLADVDPAFDWLYVFDDYLDLAEREVFGTTQRVQQDMLIFLLAETEDGPPVLFPNNT